MRYLGVDPGGRRVGLAIGDDESGVVSPVAIFPYRGVDGTAKLLVDEATRQGAGVIVIGLPTNSDGEETTACRRSRALASAVRALGSRAALQPEYLSSREATDRARARGRHRDSGIDDLAAAVILEDFLARPRPDDPSVGFHSES